MSIRGRPSQAPVPGVRQTDPEPALGPPRVDGQDRVPRADVGGPPPCSFVQRLGAGQAPGDLRIRGSRTQTDRAGLRFVPERSGRGRRIVGSIYSSLAGNIYEPLIVKGIFRLFGGRLNSEILARSKAAVEAAEGRPVLD